MPKKATHGLTQTKLFPKYPLFSGSFALEPSVKKS